uniref:Lipoprotein n=1 Tax=Streptomyces sp. NBC_01401 TaxID=2903854 RepID=A0AAU3GXG8_9ACTN
MHRSHPALRSIAVTVLLAGAAVGCGGDSDEGSSTDPAPGSDSVSLLPDGKSSEGSSASSLIEAVNETMRKTAFSSVGTSTAFEGALQHTRWNPDQGFSMKVTGTGDFTGGEMYCKDGTSYISTPLLAEMLKEKGTTITVPEQYEEVYVTSETGQGCDAYFAVSSSGTFAPDKDTTIEGKKARAVEVSTAETTDTYFVSDKAPNHLLKLNSKRDGSTSSTTYTDFGSAKPVQIPAKDSTMPMADFQNAVTAG